ncbi:MAG: RNA polymerase sigma factor [Myxococcota bacterium]
MQTDDALMCAYQRGQREAFDLLVRRHWGPVEEFARRIVKDPNLAEDVLIECFYKLHRAAPHYQAQDGFKTFLYRIAYHESISALRRQHSAGKSQQVSFSAGDGPEYQVACQQPSSEDQLLTREGLHQAEALLNTLNEVQRAVMLLYYRDELPTPDIAQALNIPVTSVRAYLSLARKAMRERATQLSPDMDLERRMT